MRSLALPFGGRSATRSGARRRGAGLVAAALVGSVLAPLAAGSAQASTCTAVPRALLGAAASTVSLGSGAWSRTWVTSGLRMVVTTAVLTPATRLHVVSSDNPVGGARTTTFQHAAATPHAIMAINGDYFSDIVRGPEIVGARLVKASTTPQKVLGVGTDGRFRDATAKAGGTVTVGGSSFPVSAVNDGTVPLDGLSVYTGAWQNWTYPSFDVAVGMRSGVVVSVVQGRDYVGAALPVPANGYLAVATGSTAVRLGGVRVGTAASVSLRAALSVATPFAHALGAGSAVETAGKAVGCISGMDSTRPRTAIGWSKDGTRVFFLTAVLDTSSAVRRYGLTGWQVGQIMGHLGAYAADLVDGGGSTTMVVRPLGVGAWTRLDMRSTTYERPIPNALVLTR